MKLRILLEGEHGGEETGCFLAPSDLALVEYARCPGETRASCIQRLLLKALRAAKDTDDTEEEDSW